MRYLIYLLLLVGFFTVQAQDATIAPEAAAPKVFNPVEQKAELCQQMKHIQETLSCEEENCPPLYENAFPFYLQFAAIQMCSFECVVGTQMCNESINPDNELKDFFGGFSIKSSKKDDYYSCDRDDNVVITTRTKESHDDEGVKHIKKITTYSYSYSEPKSKCEESVEYIEVCNEKQECQKIELYSEEWDVYERQKQMKAYEESCFVATEADCKNIEKEMEQCVLNIAEGLSKFSSCDSPNSTLWRYREHGNNLLLMQSTTPSMDPSVNGEWIDKPATIMDSNEESLPETNDQ